MPAQPVNASCTCPDLCNASPKALWSPQPPHCTPQEGHQFALRVAHASSVAVLRNRLTTARADPLSKRAQPQVRLAQPHAAPCTDWQLGWAVNKAADAAGRRVYCMWDHQQRQPHRQHRLPCRSLVQCCQREEIYLAAGSAVGSPKRSAQAVPLHQLCALRPHKASAQPESEYGLAVPLAPYHAQLN